MVEQSENKSGSNFFNEAEKLAFLSMVRKVLKNVDLVAGTKGLRAGAKELAKHKGPMFALPKGALKNSIKVETYGKNVGVGEKIILKELGDTAHALQRVSEGVKKDLSFTKNVSTVGKNFGKLLSSQIRGAKYKTVSLAKATKTGPGGRQIKGKGLFKNHKFFNRKIEGRTSAGDFIIKKRKGTLPFSMALTPVGFGVAATLLGSGKENEKIPSRIKSGIQETALWSLVPPVASVKLISDMLK